MLGTCFVISAPSAAGKSRVIQELLHRDPTLKLSVSHTTRSPRRGELNGVHYHFVTRNKFTELIECGAFLEHAEYAGNLYGTLREWVEEQLSAGTDIILEIECQGATEVRRKLGGQAVFVFIVVSLDTLERRIKKRDENTPEDIVRRLEIAKGELKQVVEFDYRVSNEGPPAEAARAIQAIIETHRLAVGRPSVVGD